MDITSLLVGGSIGFGVSLLFYVKSTRQLQNTLNYIGGGLENKFSPVITFKRADNKHHDIIGLNATVGV